MTSSPTEPFPLGQFLQNYSRITRVNHGKRSDKNSSQEAITDSHVKNYYFLNLTQGMRNAEFEPMKIYLPWFHKPHGPCE